MYLKTKHIYILAGMVIFSLFQNCSNTKFSSTPASDTTTSASQGTGTTGGNDGSGTGGSGGGSGSNNGGLDGTIAPPTSFSNTNCQLGYPRNDNQAAQMSFNESDILAAFSPQASVTVTPGMSVNVWYADEHAMTLGVKKLVVTDTSGQVTTTTYPISTMGSANPAAQLNPTVGATDNVAGTDALTCANTAGIPDSCSRPLRPSLFITDITSNPSSVAGDWQYGGTAIAPSAVYGTWKAVTKNINYQTKTVTLTTDSDPAANSNWNLGSNIPAPNVTGDLYSTMVSWNIANLGLVSGHTYRLQFMVHDGDQSHAGITGSDVGENCVNITMP